jgi:hypothetical protein
MTETVLVGVLSKSANVLTKSSCFRRLPNVAYLRTEVARASALMATGILQAKIPSIEKRSTMIGIVVASAGPRGQGSFSHLQ